MERSLRHRPTVLSVLFVAGLGAAAVAMFAISRTPAPSAAGRAVRVQLPGGTSRLVLGNGGRMELRSRDSVITPAVAADDRLIVVGSGGRDTLVVDFGAGNPIPAGGMSFRGDAAGGDGIVLRAGAFDSIRQTVAGPHAGRYLLDPDGSEVTSPTVVAYAGLARVVDHDRAAARVVTFARSAESIHRSLLGSPDGTIEIGSSLGESVAFPAPSRSMLVGARSPLSVGGHLPTGGSVEFSSSSPLTIASNVIVPGDLTLTAGETNDAPACGDDLTINAGVTVQSTGGSVTLQAGDEINNLGTASAATTLSEEAGFGDLDGCGAILHNEAVAAPTIQFSAIQDICINAINQPSSAVSATTSGGAVLDCNDPPAGTLNVTANTLALSGTTGVGTGAGGALETAVGNVEGQTTTGGIDLAEADSVSVGGVNGTLTGLSVATSGPLKLVAGGTISLTDSDGLEAVRGGASSGSVTLRANGASSDVARSNDFDAVTAPAGSITLDAGRDVLLGTVGVAFDNDVRGNNNVKLLAGRDVVVDGFADVASDDFGNNTGGSTRATAGRDIHVTNSLADDASLGASGDGGGDAIVKAAQAFVLTAPTSGAVFSTSGDVTVTASTATFGAGAGITASTGDVTLNIRGSLTLPAGVVHATGGRLTVNIDTPNQDPGSGKTFTLTGSLDAASAVVNGAGDADTFNINTAPGIRFAVNGGGGADTINGSSGPETLRGGAGGDSIAGGSGADVLRGGNGNDSLNAADGAPDDLVDGDFGTDTCTADPGDTVRECEA